MRINRSILSAAAPLGIALVLSACGGGKDASGDNALISELGNYEQAEGTISDNMTAIDGASLSADNAMLAPDSMPANTSEE